MIVVQSPLKRDFIKELLAKSNFNGNNYSFVSEKGMKLYFEIETDDLAGAVKHAKKLIKESEVGAALYFNVSHE